MKRWRVWAVGLAVLVAGGVLLTVSMPAGLAVLVVGVIFVVAGGGGGGL